MIALTISKNNALKSRYDHDAKAMAWSWANFAAEKTGIGHAVEAKQFTKHLHLKSEDNKEPSHTYDPSFANYLFNWSTHATKLVRITPMTLTGRARDFCRLYSLCQHVSGLRHQSDNLDPSMAKSFHNAINSRSIILKILDRPGPQQAIVFVPLVRDNRPIGVIRALIRQSDNGYTLVRSINQFWMLTCSIVLILMSALALVNWRRIEERVRAEREMRYYAHHDALTRLPNRYNLQVVIKDVFSRFPESGECIYLMIVDLDGFKELNDTLGHPVGDGFLIEVSGWLRKQVGDRAFVARLGGDEFAILLHGRDVHDQAVELADSILDISKHKLKVNSHILPLSLSVGVAHTSDGCRDKDTLMRHADLALYEAKHAGRACWRMFETHLEDALNDRRKIEKGLRRALMEDQLVLHYEPQYEITGGRPVGHEALLRWQDPECGLRMPSDFLDVAEQSGLVIDLGRWVLNQACKDARKYPQLGQVAINLSPLQFKSDVVDELIADALDTTGLAPKRLGVEITESILMADSEDNIATLRRVKKLGVHISLDDFGTGYSSLSYLASFPFDTIKIDRSFTERIGRKREVDAVIAAIVGIGNSLDVSILAEGVEFEEQIILLRAAGCRYVQGWLFGKPMTATNAAAAAEQVFVSGLSQAADEHSSG